MTKESDVAPTSEPSTTGNVSLVGFRSNEEWAALLDEVDGRVRALETLADESVKRQVFELLDGIDAVHREALRRLVRLFKAGVLDQVITDPAIHTLMELYDLLPEPVAQEVKRFPTIPIVAARPEPAPRSVPRVTRYPHWVPVLARADDLAAGASRDDLALDGGPLLLARRRDDWYAVDASCPVDGASLLGAELNGYTLTCPTHEGCHYDIRNGSRLGGGPPLTCRPVNVDAQGRVLVGLDMDFVPALPGF